ncbi:hypothetical protein AAX26_01789 [Aliarcobacter thereius]|uniref:hypothetical protein n=1 Tax=Aliarcobacter thereius TaxID=544718 RepID=UPI000829295A|nr:hypothetical protein [Aliarcobacter thereius]OCL85306.1 hypothetical protein AAX27_02162 [Aliarcobacter thereius]OCL85722.1 hypothetical protein AAX26_01789 [Aliarcobacter thereius]
MKYFYKTKFGTFWIVPAPQGGYNLIIDDETVNWGNSAEALANDVFTGNSGFDDWDFYYVDQMGDIECPTDLSEWIVQK